ncbi:hypothetical protein [Galbibacter sp.]|uniref:hypothetical protein n=1 Tax=Galbibacter sp. TaxID=2918471 RepID=UPI003A921755
MIINHIVEICVAIDIAILGIAYPIIIDKTSNIGDKYNSHYLAEIFKTEFFQKEMRFPKTSYRISYFEFILTSTILSFVFLIFPIKPFFGWDNFFINNSAKFLTFSLTVILIATFVIWLKQIAKYNGMFIPIWGLLLKKHHNRLISSEFTLKTINEFAIYGVKNQVEKIEEELIDFYSEEFSKYRENHSTETPVEYPDDLYFIINKLIYTVNGIDNFEYKSIEHRAISGAWLLGEDFKELKISVKSYQWLWRNINLIRNREDFLMMFWSNSHQYFQYRLSPFQDELFVNRSVVEVVNKNAIKERDEQRERFLEFHYVLGGMMMYEKNYEVLNKFFKYTQNTPPVYVLLPNNMNEVFKWFNYFNDNDRHFRDPLCTKYSFKGLEGLGANDEIINWTLKYIVVLFIRLFGLHSYYLNERYIAPPDLTREDDFHLRKWEQNIPLFVETVNKVFENKCLLEELNFKELLNSKGEEISTFVEELKERITDNINYTQVAAILSPDKVQNFEYTTNSILSDAMDKYEKIINKNNFSEKEDLMRFRVDGRIIELYSKSPFTDEGVQHMNYHSFMADWIVRNRVNALIPSSFFSSRSARYLLKEDDIPKALKRLKFDKNKHVIVVINQIINSTLLKEFEKKVIRIPSSKHQNLIFILREDDLPRLEYVDINVIEDEVMEDKVKIMNPTYKIYTSILDLNDAGNEEVRKRWNSKGNELDLGSQVQLYIFFVFNIVWKKGIKMVQLNIENSYREQGVVNNIEDVLPFDE